MITSKYFVTLSPGSNLLDFSLAYGTLSLQGENIVFSGTGGMDNVIVSPGLVFDFTKSQGGIDNIYLTGNLIDYTVTPTSGTGLTLNRGTGVSAETVYLAKGTVGNYDNVVFANGAASTFDLWTSGTAATLGTAPALPTTLNANVKAFALSGVPNGAGETFAPSPVGINFIVSGGTGTDVVYVKTGSTVDASRLGGGTDKIYFMGNWADYNDKVASGTGIVFHNTVNGERVTVAAATGTSNDRLIFADGTVLSNDAKIALLSNSAIAATAITTTVTGTTTAWGTSEVTPLPGPTVTITTDHPAILNSTNVAHLTFTLSEASTNFSLADITPTTTGGTLSNFTGSGTVYHADFRPTASSTTAATVSVAGGTFTNAASQNNVASQQLSMTVDTVAPLAPVVALVSGAVAATAAEATAGAVTVNAESGASVAVTFTGTAGSVTKTVTGTGAAQAVALAAGDLTPLGNGAVTVSAVATDVAGNVSAASTPGTGSFTLDTVAPVAPVVAVVSGAAAATAAEATAGAVTVNAESGASVAVTFTGTAGNVTKTVTGTGAAQAVALAAGDLTTLGNGAVIVSAVATDVAGNISAASTAGSGSFTLDTVILAPVVALTSAATAAATAAEATAGAVTVNAENGASVAVTFTGTAASVTKTVTGTGAAQAVALAAGDLTTLGNGAVTVSAVATDVAGNISAASTAGSGSFTLDTVAPLAPSSAATAAAGPVISTAEETAGVAVLTTLANTGAVAGDTIELLLGGASFTTPLTFVLTATEITAGSYTFTVPAGYLGADGAKSLTTVVIDAAGNVGATSAALALTLEAAAPTLTSIAVQNPPNVNTNADTLVYRVTFSEAVSNVDATDFVVTGTTATITSVTAAGANAYDVSIAGGNLAALNGNVTLAFAGTQNITDTATKALVTPTATATYTVNNIAPTGATNAATAAAGPLISAAEATTGVAVVATLTGSSAVAGDSIELKLGGASFTTPLTHVLTANDIANGYTFTVASGALGVDGAKSLTTVVTDMAGNVSAASPALALTLDTAAPLAASSAATAAAGPVINAAEATAGVAVVATLAGTGAVAGDAIELKLGGASFTTPLTHVLTTGEAAGSYTFTVASGTLGVDGAKSLTTVVTDAAGNAGAVSPALALTLDTAAPTLTSIAIQNPPNVNTNADTLVYRATFDAAVSNLDVTDFAVSGTTATVTSVSAAGANAYDVTVFGGDLAALNGAATLGFSGTQNITDAAGNALVTPPATAAYTVDNAAPLAATNVATAVAGPLINAAEATTGVAVIATLAGTGAVAGDSIELKLGGASFATPLTHVLTANEITNGYTFTVAPGTLGADGAKSLTTVVTDMVGNVGAASPALALTLDTAGPLAASSAATATAGPVVNAAEATAGVTVVATLAGTGAAAGDTIELMLGAAPFTTPLTHLLTTTDITNGSASFTVASGTLGADGAKSLTTVVTDAAGNVGATSPALALTLDTAAPTLTSIAVQNPPNVNTNADTLVYRATFDAAVSNLVATDFAVTGTTATVSSVTAAGANAYDVTISGGNLAALNGTVTLGFAGAQTITDAAGNALVTPAATAVYTVDNAAPLAATNAATAVAGPLINAAEATAGVTVVATLAGTGAAAGDSIELKLGGASFTTPLTHVLTANEITNGYTFNLASGTLGTDGAKSLTTVVTDTAGNVGAASPALALTLDTAAPLAASSAATAAAGPVISAAEATAGVTVVATLAGTNAVSGDTIELKLGGTSFATPLTHVLTASEAAGSFTFTVASGTLGADGAKSLTSVVTDAAGNVGAASPALALTLDTIPPVLNYSIATFNEAAANNGSVTATSTLTLTGDTFAGTIGQALNGALVTNVPAGLTAVVTKASDTTATLSFTGNATAHANINDVSTLTVTLGDTAFAGGNAAGVTGATNSSLGVNFADLGAIFAGSAAPDTLVGNAANNIIYGGGGADTINGSAGNDTIDITDVGATAANSASIVFTSTTNGTDTIIGFSAAAVASGGDILDFSTIVNLTDSVATGQTLTTVFAANNVFIFDGTPVTIAAAASAIALNASVVATDGYIVIADSANSNAVTVYHSTDLAANGTETALAILSGVNISNLTAANFIV